MCNFLPNFFFKHSNWSLRFFAYTSLFLLFSILWWGNVQGTVTIKMTAMVLTVTAVMMLAVLVTVSVVTSVTKQEEE